MLPTSAFNPTDLKSSLSILDGKIVARQYLVRNFIHCPSQGSRIDDAGIVLNAHRTVSGAPDAGHSLNRLNFFVDMLGDFDRGSPSSRR